MKKYILIKCKIKYINIPKILKINVKNNNLHIFIRKVNKT